MIIIIIIFSVIIIIFVFSVVFSVMLLLEIRICHIYNHRQLYQDVNLKCNCMKRESFFLVLKTKLVTQSKISPSLEQSLQVFKISDLILFHSVDIKSDECHDIYYRC